MKLFHISQDVNNDRYDTYSDAVVAAEDEVEARMIHPSKIDKVESGEGFDKYDDWAKLNSIKVRYIGEAAEGTKPGVICASLHAG